MKYLFWVFLVLFSYQKIKADTITSPKSKIFVLKNVYEVQKFGYPYIESWTDKTSKLTFEEIKSGKYDHLFSLTHTLPSTNGHFWLRFRVENNTHYNHFFLNVEFDWNSIVYIDYGKNQTTIAKQGVNIKKNERVFAGSLSEILVTLPKGITYIYVCMPYQNVSDRKAFQKTFRLAPYEIVLYKVAKQYLFDAVLLGMLLIMFIYNAFIYASIKDKVYRYYILLIAGFILYFVLGHRFIDSLFDASPDFLMFVHNIANLMGILAFFFFLLFTKYYLEITHKIVHIFYKTTQIIALLNIFLNVIHLFLPLLSGEKFYYSYILTFITNILYSIMLVGLVVFVFVIMFKIKKKEVKFYFYANMSAFVLALYHLGADDYLWLYRIDFYNQNALKVGIVSQFAIFSIALADKINTLRKNIMQEKLEKERLEKQKAIEIQQLTAQKNIELEEKVKQRTIHLQQLNEEITAQNEEIKLQSESLVIQKQEIEAKSILLAQLKDRQLMNNTLQIVQKNELLPQIGKFIKESIKNISEEKYTEYKEILKKIDQNTNIDEQWEALKMHFEQVHPNLFNELLKKNPELTNYDLRLCAYQKMGLSRKEVSALLNMNADSVRKQQYRIKQKLGLDDDVSFGDFIKTI
ncbi:MAG: hypothetical protein EAZ85_04645 [Bacteroidetes bacterium]|nr:MAG: hypothetical protein EAZ85_04645 [Bacteroidota bacterium]TAG89976.1 MAG: hypothetical protein EAZ20_05355 [Bacteroidota bacterium]